MLYAMKKLLTDVEITSPKNHYRKPGNWEKPDQDDIYLFIGNRFRLIPSN